MWSWVINNELLMFTPITEKDKTQSENVLIFDFDSTLCKTLSGKTFPKDSNDITWVFPIIPSILKDYQSKGYSIVVMSNQAGLLKSTGLSLDDWKKRTEWFLNKFDIYFLAACQKDSIYRKPNIGMWTFYSDNINPNINKDTSIYIGDAAGRLQNWDLKKTKKDFSAGDRMFAFNLNLQFKTPEEFFLNSKPTLNWNWGNSFNPFEFNINSTLPEFSSNLTEMVLMVGYPASGKSTFVKKYMSTYKRINQDELKTKTKCLSETKLALSKGQSVIIDNTNPNKETRKLYINLAKEKGIPVRIFLMETPENLAIHNNNYRGFLDGNTISSIAFRMFKSKFEEPTLDEGIKEIVKIPFIPTFKNDNHKQLFMKFT